MCYNIAPTVYSRVVTSQHLKHKTPVYHDHKTPVYHERAVVTSQKPIIGCLCHERAVVTSQELTPAQ